MSVVGETFAKVFGPPNPATSPPASALQVENIGDYYKRAANQLITAKK